MKRILFYLLVGLSLLFLLFVGTVMFYQEPIKEAVLTQVNNQLSEAELTFDEVSISIFADFPNIQLSLQEVALISTNQADLNYFLAEELSVSVNVWKYLIDKAIEVKALNADQIQLYAWTGKDGELSLLSLIKADENGAVKNSEVQGASADAKAFSFAISSYAISLKEFVYVDSTSMTQITLNNFANTGSISYSSNKLTVVNESFWNAFSFSSDGTSWIDKANGSLLFDGVIDQENSKAFFNKLDVRWNGVPLAGRGEVGFANADALEIDIRLNTALTSLESLFQSLPASYQEIPKSYEISGDFGLDLAVKGLLELDKENYPAIEAALVLKNGNLKAIEDFADLQNIVVDLSLNKPQGNLGNTSISLKQFETKVGQGFVKATANIGNPFEEATIKANVEAETNLADWKVILASYAQDIAGELSTSVSINSVLGKDGKPLQLDDRSINGFFRLNKAKVVSDNLPLNLQIPVLDLSFKPNDISLNKSEWEIGKSRFSASGSLNSLMDYLTKPESVLGAKLTVDAAYIDLDELSLAFSDTTDSELAIMPLPENIAFTAQTSIEQLKYGDAYYKDLKGLLKLENQQLNFEAVKGNFLNGTIQLSGNYSAVDAQSASTKMSINLKDIDLGEAGTYIQLLNKYIPLMKEADGKMEMGFSMNTDFTTGFEPNWETLNASGLFEAIGASVKSPAMGKLSSTLKVGDWNSLSSSKLAAKFNIIGGNLLVQPFDMNIAGNEANLGGEVSINGALKLNGDVVLPAKMLKNVLTQNLNLDETLLDKKLKVPFGFTGTLSNPKLNVNTAAVSDSYKNALNAKVQENVAELKAKAQAKAQKIREEAEARIARLTAELDQNLAKLTSERDNGVQSLLDAAGSNPFKKAAAEIAAKKLRQESDKKMQQLKSRVQSQIESISATAETEANKALNELN